MKAFNRTNREGIIYCITETDDRRTIIHIMGHRDSRWIVVNNPIDIIIVAWHTWIMHDVSIQDAFEFLNRWDREFIETGITRGEYEAQFSK